MRIMPRARYWKNSMNNHVILKGVDVVVNPRRAYAERVTVVVSCVCVYVCLYVCTHAILAVRAIRSITKDAIVLSVRFAEILKWRFP